MGLLSLAAGSGKSLSGDQVGEIRLGDQHEHIFRQPKIACAL